MVCFFFFKQKTAYEMRISDWSSDVCSSDLRDLQVRLAEIIARLETELDEAVGEIGFEQLAAPQAAPHALARDRQKKGAERGVEQDREIGRASCRERVCQYV